MSWRSRRALVLLTLLGACSLAPPAARIGDGSGQPRLAGPCRPVDAVTRSHLHYLRISSIGPLPGSVSWRVGTKVPFVRDTLTDIDVVADPHLCSRALRAYNAIVTPDSQATEIELRADTVYVAAHPLIRSGEFVTSYVFDRSFRFLGAYLQ